MLVFNFKKHKTNIKKGEKVGRLSNKSPFMNMSSQGKAQEGNWDKSWWALNVSVRGLDLILQATGYH